MFPAPPFPSFLDLCFPEVNDIIPLFPIITRRASQLPFLNQWKGENDYRKYFIINLHERMLQTRVKPATSWSSVGCASNWATEASLPRLLNVESYWDNERVIIKSFVLWSAIHSWDDSLLHESYLGPQDPKSEVLYLGLHDPIRSTNCLTTRKSSHLEPWAQLFKALLA